MLRHLHFSIAEMASGYCDDVYHCRRTHKTGVIPSVTSSTDAYGLKCTRRDIPSAAWCGPGGFRSCHRYLWKYRKTAALSYFAMVIAGTGAPTGCTIIWNSWYSMLNALALRISIGRSGAGFRIP